MILIFGANGQVGRALSAALGPACAALSREQADLADEGAVESALSAHAPRAVINAAAFTAVDAAETEVEAAHAVNAVAPAIMARYCAGRGIPFVHFSTDYVFDGSGSTPWREEDAPAPLGVYGAGKRAGEEAVRASGGKYLIFRTSWVYDAEGKNFFTTMMRLAREREELRVVNDQHGAPTYAPHLAAAALSGLEQACSMAEFPSGIYHLAAAGETTWHGFAEAIFSAARARGDALKIRRVQAISTAEYPLPAARPANSRLDCGKAKRVLGIALPSWQEGLSECMERYDARA